MKNNDKLTTAKVNTSTRRLSWFRVSLLVLVCAFLAYRGFNTINKWKESEFTEIKEFTNLSNIFLHDSYEPWFAAYVDVTSTPIYAFEQLNVNPTADVVLSFIVSSNEDKCTPTWGTYYTMDEAALTLDLDRRIARLLQQGGKIAVSFGGALNDELALKCEDSNQLLNAYESVVKRYNLDTIDLDLENEGLRDSKAAERRAIAIAELQQKMKSEGKSLAVWLTLPVAPQGLTKDGTDAVSVMLSNGVDLAGVNVMTMDYGGSKDDNHSMFEASKLALIETHRQLGILYRQENVYLNSKSVWRKIGATPMIGQNDVVEEIFTLDDAKNFNHYALEQGVGRMSMWSANRDVLCGENYVDIKVVSDSCSGVKEAKSSFAYTLSNGFEGDLSQNAKIPTVEDPEVNTQIVDDPEKSPYQIWQKTGAYPKGTKVVWHGNVYEAKWWTKNDIPDNPVLQSWEAPWQLMGPVLPGEKPIKLPTLPAGTYPEWSGTVIYQESDRILFEGNAFEAKWWNQGQSPAAAAANPDSSPWLPLSQSEILEVLNQ